MIKKIKYLIDYFKYLDNPIQALMFKFGVKKSGKISIKNHEVILNNVAPLNMLMWDAKILCEYKITEIGDYLNYIKQIDNNAEYIYIRNLKFINIYNSKFIQYHITAHLDEFFTDDAFHIINYSNRHVVDIGGNIGDTPLFFASEGAEVISFEPIKHLHNLAMENVELNPKLKDKITLVNKGVGAKRGTLSFDSKMVANYIDKDPTEMEIITLSDIFEEYDFTPDILKMDCEGCEFEIILNNDLSMFNEIIFEHHSKIANNNYALLVDELKRQGFKIKLFDSISRGWSFEDQGMIYAFR